MTKYPFVNLPENLILLMDNSAFQLDDYQNLFWRNKRSSLDYLREDYLRLKFLKNNFMKKITGLQLRKL